MSPLQESAINLLQKNEQTQVQSGAELPARTEDLPGCSRKHELKAEVTDGVQGSRASQHLSEQHTRQPSIS